MNYEKGKVLGIVPCGSIPGNVNQFFQRLPRNFLSGIDPAASAGPEKRENSFRRYIRIMR
jgi:hypothetical protein